MGRRQLCPVCTRPRDAAPDAAAAELPPLLASQPLVVAAFEVLPSPPCQRCVDRTLDAFIKRGWGGALQYLATMAVGTRGVQKARQRLAGGRRRLKGRR